MKATGKKPEPLPCPRIAFAVLLGLALLGTTRGAEIADSFNDWSFDGTQGENNWFYGYYNLTQDDDQTYDAADFIPFENDGSLVVDFDGLNHWNGNQHLLYRDTAATGGNTGPWTRVAQETGHPNGTNSLAPFSVDGSEQEEHWSIRRWVADGLGSPTELALTWHLRAANLNGGGGTGGVLFQNGMELDSAVIGGTDGNGVTRTVVATIGPGDIIDFALTPENLNGSRSDGSDGSAFRLTIDDEIPDLPPPPPPLIADSVAEFSGVQGQDNWSYGYYDLREDAENGNGVYDADEFMAFLNDGSNFVVGDDAFGAWVDGTNHWDGGKWDLLDNGLVSHGPWTQITANGGHPAANAQGDDEVQWNVRRWESEVDGTVKLTGVYSNTSANGDGTVGRIFVDGEEVWSELSDGDTINYDVDVDVIFGSLVDFATDPDGADVYDEGTGIGYESIADGNDGTTFTIQIAALSVISPEALQPGDADEDLDFDQIDLVQVQIGGKYLTGNPATWGEGDWDGGPGGSRGSPPAGNGLFDQVDIIAALNAGVYLTGPYAAVVDGGVAGDGQASIVYDPGTGEVSVDAPAGVELTSINVDSAAGIFTGEAAENLGGSFDNDADGNIFKATFGGSFGTTSFGNVAQAGLSKDFLLNDLSVVGSLSGGGDLGEVDLVYVPEPTAAVLILCGVLGLSFFRRHT